MQFVRSRLVGLALSIGVLILWLSPPGAATALEVEVAPDGFAVVAVPAVSGATQLWIDVEAPGLLPDDVVATFDGAPVALRQTPFGAGVVLPHDGAAASLAVGLEVAAEPDISITLADAEGRILLADSARVAMTALNGEQTPPITQPTDTAVPPAPNPPATTPPATTPPGTTPPGTVAPPVTAAPPGKPYRPTPGLPSSGDLPSDGIGGGELA